MWYLSSENDTRIIYVVLEKPLVTIGRSVDTQTCDFAVPDDPSISRKHATITLSNNNLQVEDLGSRYGTFVNESSSKIEANCKIEVHLNDIIKFGKIGCVWKVHKVNFVTCTSTLKGENLDNLKKIITKLGGEVKNEWTTTCAYLTMPAITLTIKVVLALLQGSHIVTTDFWNKCNEAVANNAKLPDPEHFLPEVVESTLNKEKISFAPNLNRKALFAGKKFIFFSRRQLEMYKAAVLAGSAEPLLLSESKFTKSMLCESNIVVIQYNFNSNQETQAQKVQIDEIVAFLKNKGKRIVADAEIGLAILYCSTDKYCNPDFNFSTEVVKQAPESNKKMANVLAQESQDPTNSKMVKKENVVINESLASKLDLSNPSITSSKRKWTDNNDEHETNANKKLALNKLDINNSESAKRKLNEDDNTIQSNPSKKMAIHFCNEGDDDDSFNFKAPLNSETTTEKKLHFSKPTKRKLVATNEEDDLFNFVEDKTKCSIEKSSHTIFEKTENTNKDIANNHSNKDNTFEPLNSRDIAALRGTKLKELFESHSKLNYVNQQDIKTIKTEVDDELGEKMNGLDIGSVVVTIKKDLIVKKEPIVIEAHPQVKNFKKFKKVWPLKMSASIIPITSMNVVNVDASHIQEINSLVYDA